MLSEKFRICFLRGFGFVVQLSCLQTNENDSWAKRLILVISAPTRQKDRKVESSLGYIARLETAQRLKEPVAPTVAPSTFPSTHTVHPLLTSLLRVVRTENLWHVSACQIAALPLDSVLN